MSSLTALLAAAPGGRALVIDHDAYATAVLRQGSEIPWGDLAALTGHVAQVQALLDPDAVFVNAEAFYDAYLAATPDLVSALGKRSRTGYALRTLLGDEPAVERLVLTMRTLADSTRRRVVLSVPSPARWLLRAHDRAGTGLDEVSEDHADSASMYLAEWLGRLGSPPLGLLLLDARARRGDSATLEFPERAGGYTSLTNVAGHFDWTLAVRFASSVDVAGDVTRAVVLPDAFWHGEGEAPRDEARLVLTTIPADAPPETVLLCRALLKEG
ncbi:hypothetical protein E0F15_16050 [Frankia sp. B2]|uniref:hypothetical protein n=1 Tax=unclassified Frankia TaxID=2632575 RepID=UPI000460DB3D|nr:MULTISPECIES: hypothetical protein [unclassified Frankia]KDA41502.1 hypothetical protein BMG523Draft_03698 [Frankia sp. BMG5.23]TFE27741.1 hypothetical protein E0F15_16050 [Frankia sp. B2]